MKAVLEKYLPGNLRKTIYLPRKGAYSMRKPSFYSDQLQFCSLCSSVTEKLFKLYKDFLILFIVFTLSSCGSDSRDNNSAACKNSGSNPLKCVHKTDFVDANGVSTDQSKNIADCTILGKQDFICLLAELNFIAIEGSTPTKQQIMDKLIVSHPWMADNFSSYLDNLETQNSRLRDDMYDLFSSVTAIVIHSEIRPAFFWSETGAIYLDPQYLWLTEDQYNTISKQQDYRSDYDKELNFTYLTQYTKNGQYAFGEEDSRTETQMMYLLSALLFHELAHARDAFPVSNILSGLPTDIPRYIMSDYGETSEALYDTYPLLSDTMTALGQVQYQGEKASTELIALTASDVGDEFETDGANDSYNYSYIAQNSSHITQSMPEDTAMLFEETMMNLHFGINREISFVTELVDNAQFCEDFSFDWTAINRFAHNNVNHRAILVVDSLLPNHTHTDFSPSNPGHNPFSQCSNAGKGNNTPRKIPTQVFWY